MILNSLFKIIFYGLNKNNKPIYRYIQLNFKIILVLVKSNILRRCIVYEFIRVYIYTSCNILCYCVTLYLHITSYKLLSIRTIHIGYLNWTQTQIIKMYTLKFVCII